MSASSRCSNAALSLSSRRSMREIGLLGVGLRADGDILARRHRHRARDQRGCARDQHVARLRARRCDADDQARGRDDAVIGAEHRGPQPADAAGMVVFGMDAKTGHPGYGLKKLRTSSLMSSTDTLIEELDGDLEEPAGIGFGKPDLDLRRRRFICADRSEALLAQAAAQGEGQSRLVEFERQFKPTGERRRNPDQSGWRWSALGIPR